MSLAAKYQDMRKDLNYQQQINATVEEIAVALPEAEKLATDDPKLSAFQALKQIIKRNRESGVNTDVAKDSPELRKAQKLAAEAAAAQAAANVAAAAVNAKRERYWYLVDTLIPKLESALERADYYISKVAVLEDELIEIAYRSVESEHTGERQFDSLVFRPGASPLLFYNFRESMDAELNQKRVMAGLHLMKGEFDNHGLLKFPCQSFCQEWSSRC